MLAAYPLNGWIAPLWCAIYNGRMETNETSSHALPQAVVIGIVLGVVVGLGVGLVMGNLAWGIGIGIAFGFAMGTGFWADRKRR